MIDPFSQMKREYDTILDDADSVNRNNFAPSQSFTPVGALPYMGYIGMCRCEGYGLQAVYSRIGYINQSVWV